MDILLETKMHTATLDGIATRDAVHRRAKTSKNNHRLRSSSETLEIIRGILPIAGVTRLANITGLDRIGIPVTLAVRPNSRGVASSAGKGMCLTDAYLSAAMEALERYHAEVSSVDISREPYDRVCQAHSVIPVTALPIRRRCKFIPSWPHDWVLAWDLVAQEHVAIPLSMVNLASKLMPYDFPLFQSTSVGLAGGGDLLEAILEGLLEVVEHDSVTCHQYKESISPTPDIEMNELESISGEITLVLQHLKQNHMFVSLKNCTNDLEIPAFEAKLFDKNQAGLGQFYGHAAHLDARTAALKAILEAIQSRTVYIAGSRDDYFRRHMNLSRIPRRTSPLFPTAGHCYIGGSLKRTLETDTLHGDIQVIIRALRKAGLEQILLVDLSLPWNPAVIVKIVVPGLEGPTGDGYERGQRARRCMEGAL